MSTLELFTKYQQALEQDARAARRLVRATKEREDASRYRDASQSALERARAAFEGAVMASTNDERSDQ